MSVQKHFLSKSRLGDNKGAILDFNKAIVLGSKTCMIVDIGGQRLLEIFIKTDPINFRVVEQMNAFFRTFLLLLANACRQYQPIVLVGSFDTLVDMWLMKTQNQLPDKQEISFDLTIQSFYESYEDLLLKNKEERVQIAGMISLRIEMIVVVVCLIRFISQTFEIKQIKVSRYALKEDIRESL